MNRLREKYIKEVVPSLTEKYNYSTPMLVPKLEKIVVNMGVGDATVNSKNLENAVNELEKITGLKAVETTAKKSIASFKVREGHKIGCKVTLRGEKMYTFLDKLISISLPRVRDFRGLSPKSFDGRGNYTIGIKEQIIFPEINFDEVEKVRGMDVVLVTTAKTNEEAFDLLKEVAFESKLDNKKRLKEIIGQIYTNLKITLTETGHKSAANRVMSYFSEYAAYREAIQGITMYETVKKWYEDFDEEYDNIVNGLKEAAKMIFEKQNMTISYTGKEEAPEFMKAEVESFIEGLYEDQKQGEKVKVTCTKSNEGFATAGGVQYVACAGNFKDAGLEYSGALIVLQIIFSYEYLWIQIRVKGGAYGCMCSFSDQGDSMFVTYRDPNLSESYKVYDEAADYVADFDADDRDMKKYIIGTIGSMDMPMEAVDMGARSFHAYFLGKTEADLQKVRDQVLSCTQEDI